ncbi:MAG: class I SAM-dependent methyltransferase [Candidatus Firestonebacteria bacterium]|nr:class I SAM-dependent methyltransferase [Candidatus Firestonebacteria bacterium]
MKNIPNQQNLEAKRAESKRPFSGENILKDEGLNSMHRERAKMILTDLKELEEIKNISSFNPFLEIGAGSVQRSTALMNNYLVNGVATDISQNSLLDTPYILSLLNYKRKPMMICCDAHYLPFLSNTFQFIFAYQTLHHFENPIPVIDECYRVLGKGGYFYFNEEPMDSILRRLLRGNRMLSHPPTRLQR